MSLEADDATRLAEVRERISRAAAAAGRKADAVTLLGVSKRVTAERVAAAVRRGLRDVGESYVQEADAKLPEVKRLLEESGHNLPRWHFIGQLQSNKARRVADTFDVVHTVDRERLGAGLNRRAEAAARPLEVLLQVDLSGEPGKGGAAPERLADLLAVGRDWPQLRVIGLMAIPAPVAEAAASRPAFARLRALRDELRERPGGGHLSELSMGMSQDFEVAVEEGATIVRIGTAIFGAR